jgi:hypothetical protein
VLYLPTTPHLLLFEKIQKFGSFGISVVDTWISPRQNSAGHTAAKPGEPKIEREKINDNKSFNSRRSQIVSPGTHQPDEDAR